MQREKENADDDRDLMVGIDDTTFNEIEKELFSFILADLIITLKKICNSESDSQIVIVLDKGNNSKENFKTMAGKISSFPICWMRKLDI
jgi:hypothetical protein